MVKKQLLMVNKATIVHSLKAKVTHFLRAAEQLYVCCFHYIYRGIGLVQ